MVQAIQFTPQFPVWIETFGDEYEVPNEVVSLLWRGFLKDVSARKDGCPKFKICDKHKRHKTGYVEVFVEHPRLSRRNAYMSRYHIRFHDDEHEVHADLLETDSIDRVVDWVYNYV